MLLLLLGAWVLVGETPLVLFGLLLFVFEELFRILSLRLLVPWLLLGWGGGGRCEGGWWAIERFEALFDGGPTKREGAGRRCGLWAVVGDFAFAEEVDMVFTVVPSAPLERVRGETVTMFRLV